MNVNPYQRIQAVNQEIATCQRILYTLNQTAARNPNARMEIAQTTARLQQLMAERQYLGNVIARIQAQNTNIPRPQQPVYSSNQARPQQPSQQPVYGNQIRPQQMGQQPVYGNQIRPQQMGQQPVYGNQTRPQQMGQQPAYGNQVRPQQPIYANGQVRQQQFNGNQPGLQRAYNYRQVSPVYQGNMQVPYRGVTYAYRPIPPKKKGISTGGILGIIFGSIGFLSVAFVGMIVALAMFSSDTTTTTTYSYDSSEGGIQLEGAADVDYVELAESYSDPLVSSKGADGRIPNADDIEVHGENFTTKDYSWHLYQSTRRVSLSLDEDDDIYDYYRHLGRFRRDDDLHYFYNDPVNRAVIEKLVDAFDEIAEDQDLSAEEEVGMAVTFVQNLEYVSDEDSRGSLEWYKYPIETLYDQGGDCEDSSILCAMILREMGYDSALFIFDDHMACGVSGSEFSGDHFTFKGKDYYYIETTSDGWYIGEFPEDYGERDVTIWELNDNH